jgi:hypothetical protein
LRPLKYNSDDITMKNLLTIVFLLFTGLVCCKKSENDLSSKGNSSLKIIAGFICGWGTGEDSLYISKTSIKYVYYIPATSMLPQINKTRSVQDTEWVNIVNSIDLNEFVKLNYNSCNICVDGCDEWISIQNNQISHQIRFSKGMKIDSIYKLQQRIARLRSEFSR